MKNCIPGSRPGSQSLHSTLIVPFQLHILPNNFYNMVLWQKPKSSLNPTWNTRHQLFYILCKWPLKTGFLCLSKRRDALVVWVCVCMGMQTGRESRLGKSKINTLGHLQIIKFIFNTDNNYRSQTCPGCWKKRVTGSPSPLHSHPSFVSSVLGKGYMIYLPTGIGISAISGHYLIQEKCLTMIWLKIIQTLPHFNLYIL